MFAILIALCLKICIRTLCCSFRYHAASWDIPATVCILNTMVNQSWSIVRLMISWMLNMILELQSFGIFRIIFVQLWWEVTGLLYFVSQMVCIMPKHSSVGTIGLVLPFSASEISWKLDDRPWPISETKWGVSGCPDFLRAWATSEPWQPARINSFIAQALLVRKKSQTVWRKRKNLDETDPIAKIC